MSGPSAGIVINLKCVRSDRAPRQRRPRNRALFDVEAIAPNISSRCCAGSNSASKCARAGAVRSSYSYRRSATKRSTSGLRRSCRAAKNGTSATACLPRSGTFCARSIAPNFFVRSTNPKPLTGRGPFRRHELITRPSGRLRRRQGKRSLHAVDRNAHRRRAGPVRRLAPRGDRANATRPRRVFQRDSRPLRPIVGGDDQCGAASRQRRRFSESCLRLAWCPDGRPERAGRSSSCVSRCRRCRSGGPGRTNRRHRFGRRKYPSSQWARVPSRTCGCRAKSERFA